MSLELTDTIGSPVLSVQSSVVRPITAQQLASAVTAAGGQTRQELLEVVWTPIALDHSSVDDHGGPSVITWDEMLTGAGAQRATLPIGMRWCGNGAVRTSRVLVVG